MDSCIFIKKIWNIYNLTGGVEMDNPKSLLNDENVCFLMGDDLENGCFNEADSTCGDGCTLDQINKRKITLHLMNLYHGFWGNVLL